MPTKSNNTGGQGGKRSGAGRKKSPVKEKAENGNPGGRKLEVLDIPEMEGVEMPKPHDFLSAEQRDGTSLQAAEIYKDTWEWLNRIGCSSKVSPQLLERYAMCSARWIQCEEMTNRLGFLSKHPTTQKPNSLAVYQYRNQLHESGGQAVERDISDSQGELQHRLR